MKLYAFLLLLGGGALAALAQSSSFTYQGRLTESGLAFSGLADMQFTLFSAPTGGVALAASGIVSVTVADGLFTVPLDFGAAAFPGADRYLQIAARTNGSSPFIVLSPRQQVTATPYATRAANFSGGVSDGQLSANIARLNGNETFSGAVNFSNVSNNFAGSFTGNGALPWQVVSGTSQQAQSNTGYVVTNTSQVTMTLPTAPILGDVVRLTGAGAGGWKIAQNAGQQILGANLGLAAGASWTARLTDSNRAWTAVASSADGSKLVATVNGGQVYTSTDSGVNWTARDINRGWSAIASSADGSKLVAGSVVGQIYTSTDSGTNWIGHDSNRVWVAAASSTDGSKLVAAVGSGQIYTSTDSGTNWTAHESARQWIAVASSSEGANLVAAVDGGQIYTSIDSGVGWVPHESNRSWHSVASSADGTKLVAVPFGGQIYTSTDSGASWTPRLTDATRGWYAVASSGDGSKLVAVVRGGQIYTSTDSGATWTPRDSNQAWQSVASSEDGSKLIAVVVNGEIFTSTAPSTAGTAGFLMGGPGAAIELQYIGNNQFLALSHQGTISGN